MSVGKTSHFGACVSIPLNEIVDSPYQVRVDYGDIEGLARDINDKGLLQPILLRPVDGGKFEIVHGHRRHKAVSSLRWGYIDAFVKELSNVEAMRIQGSENIWRKDYTPIEEARLYLNYRAFLERETHGKVSVKEIAEAYQTSEDNVTNKVALLDLPLEIQDKLHQGQIPFSKARQLTILTRENPTPIGVGEIKPAAKTDHFYNEIKRLAQEIEKGALGGLRTEKGVAGAAQAIRNGVPYEEAVEKAKVDESIRLAQQQLQKGASVPELLKQIMSSGLDSTEIVEGTREANT